jgi:hypothetical protein
MAPSSVTLSIDPNNGLAGRSRSKKRRPELNENRFLEALKRRHSAGFDELWRPHAERILRLAYRSREIAKTRKKLRRTRSCRRLLT